MTSETSVWPSIRKTVASQTQVNVTVMLVFRCKRFKTLLGDLRGEMATLLLPEVFCGTVLTVSPMVMVRGGVTGVLWVTTRPVDKRRDTDLDITAMLLKKEKLLLMVYFIKTDRKVPVTTGATEAGLDSPLLFRAFVMMSFVIIGPAVDTGGFFVSCDEKYDTRQLFQLPMIDTEQEIKLHFNIIILADAIFLCRKS